MKKLLFVILALFVFSVRADNTITSKEYVDGQVATLQTQIPAKNTNTVVTNTGTAGTIGEKAIYDTTATYNTQTDALVTAGAFNSAVQNALESEFVCVEWQGNVHDNAHCLLYEVRGAAQTQTLPSGYTQLEYLESTGTQYIDTGDNATTNMSFEISFSDTILSQEGSQLIGTGNIGVALYRLLGWVCRLPNTLFYYSLTNSDAVTDILYITPTSITSQNYQSSWIQRSDRNQPNNSNVLIFSNVIGKLFYAKIWEGDMLTHNFIPAQRNSDNEIGMYDLVSNTFFTNAGTGEFIAGPVVYF